MPKTNHWGIFLSNNADKNLIIQQIINSDIVGDLKSKNVVVFSEIILKDFIENESRFGKVEMMSNSNRSLATLSGGEQKKALLNHCLLQNPDYLILDNPFDNLDIDSQKKLAENLYLTSKKTNIIQLINRLDDRLLFIENTASFNAKNKLQKHISIQEFNLVNKALNDPIFYDKIPEPIVPYTIEYQYLVQLFNVTIKYENITIVNDINWQIKPREFWQLIGPNGAGKTTILSLIIGDNPKAYRQNIKLFGKQKGTGESVWEIKKMIGYFTPSITNLFARNTTCEHMIISGIFDSIGLYTIPSERHLRLAKEWLILLDFKHLAKVPFHKLTAGQQRLIMIARAMVKHPPLLILDEPTAGLDDHNALIVSKLINKISEESNTSILYVSHRKETGLKPEFTYELTKTNNGSIGRQKVNS